MARAVASEIIQALGITSEPSRRKILLGDPSLLSMDMGGASAYWEIPVPIGKRDRKNGQRKRKQGEIELRESVAVGGES